MPKGLCRLNFFPLLFGADTSKAAFNVLAPFALFILLFSYLSMLQDRCRTDNSNGTRWHFV